MIKGMRIPRHRRSCQQAGTNRYNGSALRVVNPGDISFATPWPCIITAHLTVRASKSCMGPALAGHLRTGPRIDFGSWSSSCGDEVTIQ